MAGWRDRFDRTTNWAITVIAAMLSVSLSAPAAHHSILLFAMLLVMLLLLIEARRYRFYDVYRGRVRRLERCYFAPFFASEPSETIAWTREMASDLRRPVFRITFLDAITRRLRRNYIWIFLILLLAWVLKCVTLLPGTAAKVDTAKLDVRFVVDHAAIGPLSGWWVVGMVAAFFCVLVGLSLRRTSFDVEDGTVHV